MDLPEHSPLGASGMEIWEPCPGSRRLLELLGSLPASDAPRNEDDGEEPEHRARGTAAHTIIDKCLRGGHEAWEFVGETVDGVLVDAKIVHGAQMFIDHVTPLMVGADHVYIEYKIHTPDIHPLAYSRLDFGAIREGTAYLRDYKNGVLIREADCNQLRYYMAQLLTLHDDVRRVDMGIIQPNGFHMDGPIRTAPMLAEDIHEWTNNTLIPAMKRAETDDTLCPGDHCRFCPAKLICPSLKDMYEEMSHTGLGSIPKLTDDRLGTLYPFIEPVKMFIKALEDECYHRSMNGRKVPGCKLIGKRGYRIYRDGAEAKFSEVYGEDAYTKPELKSPAQMEALGPHAKDLVKEFAYTVPSDGYTLVPESHAKPAVQLKTIKDVFGKSIDRMKKSADDEL